jgi:hypothetical protein
MVGNDGKEEEMEQNYDNQSFSSNRPYNAFTFFHSFSLDQIAEYGHLSYIRSLQSFIEESNLSSSFVLFPLLVYNPWKRSRRPESRYY